MSQGPTRRALLLEAGAVCSAVAWGSGARPVLAQQGKASVEMPHGFTYALNTSTVSGQKLTLAEEFDVAGKAGYDGIEPWMGKIHEYVQGGGSLGDLRKRSQDLGLVVGSAIGFARWIVDDDQERAGGIEQLKRDMDSLAQLGGTHIAAPPAGANRPGPRIDLDRIAHRYRTILELGARMGVVPQIEVWGSSANLSHLADAIYVAARAAHPQACVLADVYHLYKGGTDPWVLRLLGRSAVHCFHMNDYPVDPPRETIRDSDRIWPGDGIAPIAQILKLFAQNHCQVMLSLELFNQEYWKLPASEVAKIGLEKMKNQVQKAGLA